MIITSKANSNGFNKTLLRREYVVWETHTLLTSDALSTHFSSFQQWVVIGGYEPGTRMGSGSSDEKDTDLAFNDLTAQEWRQMGKETRYYIGRQVKHRYM